MDSTCPNYSCSINNNDSNDYFTITDSNYVDSQLLCKYCYQQLALLICALRMRTYCELLSPATCSPLPASCSLPSAPCSLLSALCSRLIESYSTNVG